MVEYHVRQFDGGPTICDGRNCACASGAMAVAFGSGGKHTPTSDEFRQRSGQSCIPGVHSPSGGLFISDVERTAATYGVEIDYGPGFYRWTATQQKTRLKMYQGMVCLGDYDQIPSWLDEQPGFNGDHSVFIHDYRISDDTVCWHDPLGDRGRRVKWDVVVAYNHKPNSPVRGLAGFIKLPLALPPTDTEGDVPGLNLRPLGQLVAGVASVPKGTEIIYSATRERAVTTADASGRQATGLYDPQDIGDVQRGYEINFAEGMAWVREAFVDFTPHAVGAREYAVFVGGKPVGNVKLP